MDTSDLAGLPALSRHTPPGRRAVVIGASLAGLLAARVLSESFDEVVVLDRDAVPTVPAHRKATPHTRHAHGLLARGCQALEELFPGIRDEWIAAGGRPGDLQRNVPFYGGRTRFASGTAGVQGMSVGRVVIEATVRQRVLALPQVRLASGVEVQGLALSADRRSVCGVKVLAVASLGDAGCAATRLPAALVVDAGGRASRLPQWLRAAGFEAPAEERVKVDIRYATAYFERLPGEVPGAEVVLCTATPDCPLPAVLLAQEGERWVITLGGYSGDVPELDRAGFIRRAQRMAPEIAEVAQAGRFVADPIGYRFPHSQRRRYEHLRRFPQGLLALGDSICSFNPIYGQGMTVAACEALVLRQVLDARGAALPADLAKRFFKAAARIVDVAWTTAVGADLAIPSVEGKRSPAVRLVNAYVARVFRAAQHDPVVALAFLKVAHLLEQPPSLMRPAMLLRVLRAAWRPGAAAAALAPGVATLAH